MKYRRGQRVTLQVGMPGQEIQAAGGVGQYRKSPVEIEAGEAFQFFRQFKRDGETHYVFHTGGAYVGRRYVITTEPDVLFPRYEATWTCGPQGKHYLVAFSFGTAEARAQGVARLQEIQDGATPEPGEMVAGHVLSEIASDIRNGKLLDTATAPAN